MSKPNPTVFIVDDDTSVRDALNLLLNSAGYEVQAFASAESFLDSAGDRPVPACVVSDVKMPGLNGLELQDDVCEIKPPLPFIFITGHGDIPMSVKAMKKGAVDFLTKPFDDEQLLEAVKKALKKDEESHADFSKLHCISLCLDTLTEREREVLTYLIAGLLNKQVAYELDIAERTVKAHRKRIFEKMKVASIAELVRLTEKAGLQPFKTDQP